MAFTGGRKRLEEAAASHSNGHWISDRIFVLHEPRPPESRTMDIMFFHGLQMKQYSDAHVDTWRSGDGSGQIWPQSLLPNDFPTARIMTISYDASLWESPTEGRMDLHLTGESLMMEIVWARKKQGQIACPLVLVGHCFGGIVIKQLCVWAKRNIKQASGVENDDMVSFLQSIGGICFYATPHRGVEEISKVVSAENKGQIVELVKVLSSESARLDEDFRKLLCMQNHEWSILSLGETQVTRTARYEVFLVPEASSRFYADGKYVSVDADHFSICRPSDFNCTPYCSLATLISDVARRDMKVEEEPMIRGGRVIIGMGSLLNGALKALKRKPFLGITGTGGVGKTTLASLVFDKICSRFEYSCFVQDVKLISGRKYEVKKHVLSEMRHRGRTLELQSWRHLRGRRLLLVFDDVPEEGVDHVDLLAEIASENGEATSRFILTCRNAEDLRRVDEICIISVPLMKNEDARKLFLKCAFPSSEMVPEHFLSIIEEIVVRCGGVPQVLEVLGKRLKSIEDRKIWEETSEALQRGEGLSGLDRVWTKLEESYNNLGSEEQELFLDIACYFSERRCFSREQAMIAWSSMYGSPHTRIRTLMERSLIMSLGYDGNITMHEHLRTMGQRIAKRLGRVCHEIITEDLVEGVSRGSSLLYYIGKYLGFQRLEDGVTARVPATRYMEIRADRSQICAWGQSPPTHLVMLHWVIDTPTRPLRLNATVYTNLVVLVFSGLLVNVPLLDSSKTKSFNSSKLWDSFPNLEYLRFEKLGDLGLLQLEPGQLRRLRQLTMESSYVTVPHTLGQLSALEHLIFSSKFERSLPATFGKLLKLKSLRIDKCPKLEELPSPFGELASLEKLELFSLDSLGRLPATFGKLLKLKSLKIDKCPKLEELPPPFGELASLENLELFSLDSLERFPATFGKLTRLKSLSIRLCPKLERLAINFGEFRSLEVLSLDELFHLGRIGETFGSFMNLKSLIINLEIEYLFFENLEIENLHHNIKFENPFVDEDHSIFKNENFPENLKIETNNDLHFNISFRYAYLLYPDVRVGDSTICWNVECSQ